MENFVPKFLHEKDQNPEDIEKIEKLKIGDLSNKELEGKIRQVLSENKDVFAWSQEEVQGVKRHLVKHKLNINPIAKLAKQKLRSLNVERRSASLDKIIRLGDLGFKKEVQYPKWSANIVMVRKVIGGWRFCIDFTKLNIACPKESYPLPNIDSLIDRSSSFEMFSFMDVYLGYNQIYLRERDEEATYLH